MDKKGKVTSKYKKQEGTAIGGPKESKVISAKGHTPNMYELYKEGAFGAAKESRGLNKGGGLKSGPLGLYERGTPIEPSTPLQPRSVFDEDAPIDFSTLPTKTTFLDQIRDAVRNNPK